MEQWRDIAGYEGLYQVSDHGRVKRVDRGNILVPCRTTDGYLRVKLCRHGVQCSICVHRLVAAAFIQNQDNKPEVNHIDGNKTNNRADNIEWVTHHENVLHACRTGLRDREEYRRTAIANGKKASRAIIRSDGVVFDSMSEAARAIGKTQTAVFNVCKGIRKTAGGYGFKYAD